MFYGCLSYPFHIYFELLVDLVPRAGDVDESLFRKQTTRRKLKLSFAFGGQKLRSGLPPTRTELAQSPLYSRCVVRVRGRASEHTSLFSALDFPILVTLGVFCYKIISKQSPSISHRPKILLLQKIIILTHSINFRFEKIF